MYLRTPLVLAASMVLAVALVSAQGQGGAEKKSTGGASNDPVARMMAFDRNKDGKLTRDEITDSRLLALFDRADTNKDGVVTVEELNALFEREALPGGDFGKGGPKGKGGFGPFEKGGPPEGAFGGPPLPGQVLPLFLRKALDLNAEQQGQIDALQKEVDARLGQILTAQQKQQLKQLRERGPGGFGPRPE